MDEIDETVAEETLSAVPSNEQPRVYQPQKRKKRLGDRRDGRLLRTLYGMNKMMPFIMKDRSDGCNTYADEFDVTE